MALHWVKSLEGLLIDEPDCSKSAGKLPCNNDELTELNRLRNMPNENKKIQKIIVEKTC